MTTKGIRILIIDDEPQIRRMLRIALTAHGYEIGEAACGETGLQQSALFRPDLIILDLGLPDLDGIDVVQNLREWTKVPILVLSVRDHEQDKIKALDLGADDYLTKPFGIGELLARIRAALRHARGSSEDPVLHFGGLIIDLAHRTVTSSKKEVKLTPIEWDILKALAINGGKVLTHKQLLNTVWGPGYEDQMHYLRVYVGQLRRKVEINPAQPCHIITEPGVGYRLL